MKNKILLIHFLLFTFSLGYGQDIHPETQSQGYLDNKGITVDHPTGIFYYKIPLFNLQSGEFTLPIELLYSAKGVKYTDIPGPLGYNWNLIAGGVVTRTLRGGIPDETDSFGIANSTVLSLSLEEDIRNVNKQGRDGEHDIFTASFNGQNLDFIIKNKDINKFEIEPLEKTNCKIEYIAGNHPSRRIIGWVIIDENGRRFVFEELEWTENLIKEQPVPFNTFLVEKYISSWYLSRIEIPGANTLVFKYNNPYVSGSYTDHDAHRFHSNSEIVYQYGHSLFEYPFNWEKYEKQFDEYIRLAEREINHHNDLLHLQSRLYEFSLATKTFSINTSFFVNQYQYQVNQKILGTTMNFRNISGPSSQAISLLNSLANSTHSSMAANYFKLAKNTIIKCIQETQYINEKRSTLGTVLFTYTPLLTSITNGNQSIDLTYEEHYYDNMKHRISEIALKDEAKRSISTVKFSFPKGNLLKNITWYGSDKQKYDHTDLSYFHEDIFRTYMQKDMWGFCKLSNTEAPSNLPRNEFYTNWYTLKTIENSKGGKIELDYEPNILHWENSNRTYAGIRLKSLISDPGAARRDTIKYNYATSGTPIYTYIDNVDIIQYLGFQDKIYNTTDMYLKGNAVMQGGNNGLYYQYIEEEICGKGYNTYLYSLPLNYANYLKIAPPFWIPGQLMAKGIYDKNKNLVKLQRNRYYGEVIPEASLNGPIVGGYMYVFRDWYQYLWEWFETPPQGLAYSKKEKQVKANGNYLDAISLSQYYQSEGKIILYQDGLSFYSVDSYDLYLRNLEPRTRYDNSEQLYTLYYGGKTVLKEQKEYAFTGNISNTLNPQHLYGTLPEPHILTSHTEYIYDNHLIHANPTRIIHHQSNGDKIIDIYRGPLDFEDNVNSVLQEMKRLNILNKPVKRQKAIERNGVVKLLGENLTLYEKLSDSVIRPVQELQLSYEANAIPSLSALDNKFYTADASLYRKYSESGYEKTGRKFQSTTLISLQDTIQQYYDQFIDISILTTNCDRREVSGALANYRFVDFDINAPEDMKSLLVFFYENHHYLNDFLLLHNSLDLKNASINFKQFYESTTYQAVLEMTQLLVNHGDSLRVFQLLPTVQNVINDFSRIESFSEVTSVNRYCDLSYFRTFVMFYMIWLKDHPEYYTYLPQGEGKAFVNYNKTLSLKPDNKYSKFKIFALVHGNDKYNSFKLSYYIRVGNNTVSPFPFEYEIKKDAWQLIAFDADFSGLNATEFNINLGSTQSKVGLLVVVPENVEFEAQALDEHGLPAYQLNHNGIIESYKYDGIGRLTHIYDKDGNLLQEIKYSLLKD